MKEFWNTIQLAFAAVGGWLGYFLGGCDGLLYALLAFVVIDYITGVMYAIADKNLSSEWALRASAERCSSSCWLGLQMFLMCRSSVPVVCFVPP